MDEVATILQLLPVLSPDEDSDSELSSEEISEPLSATISSRISTALLDSAIYAVEVTRFREARADRPITVVHSMEGAICI